MAAMTDKPNRKHRRRPGPAVVALSSLSAFLMVLTLMVFQMRGGHDPALSASAQTVAARQPQIVVRKVEDDYVTTKVIPAQQQSGSAAVGSAPPASSPAPRVSTSAPAPAPAPAPVTRTS
jgi:hypothetical protein